MLSVLVSARRNSKYLAKFMFGLFENSNTHYLDIHVMLSEHDTWNNELVSFFSKQGVKFHRENMQLGRAGLHEYFNEMIPNTRGSWVIYFCEDHFVSRSGWDHAIDKIISGVLLQGDSEGKKFPLNPTEPWVIVPQFDNCGAMNHVLSSGFISALNGKIGQHGWIDSYINDLMAAFPDRVIRMDEAYFHDFTHDVPSPMADSEVQALSTEKGKALPNYDSDLVRMLVEGDRERIKKALKGME